MLRGPPSFLTHKDDGNNDCSVSKKILFCRLLASSPRNPSLAHACRQQGIPGFAAVRGRGRETGVPCAPSPPRARCLDDQAVPRGRRTLTAPARGLSQRRQGFPVVRESGRESRARHACVDPLPTPALRARESSPAAVRTGGGAGKLAQTGVGFAEAWVGEGASAGSSPGSSSGPRRRLGNRARPPQCGGGGSLGEAGRLCACVGLRACGWGFPSCA